MKSHAWGALSLIAMAAFARLIPHPANVTPIAAMALFSGAVFSRKPYAVFIPLIAMFISDLCLGLHDQIFSVYGSIVLIALLGSALLVRLSVGRRSFGRLWVCSILSSSLFFVVTNFSVWLGGGGYERSATGLVKCFVAALPFFRNELVGTFVFANLMFGAWVALTRPQPVRVKVKVESYGR